MEDILIENNLYLARISYMSGMPEEALKYIEEIIKLKNGIITEEERNIFFSTLKTLINNRRDSWRTVNALESKEKKNEASLLPRVTELKLSIEEEMKNFIYKGLELIETKLLKNANSDELIILYSKVRGDYLRYLIEIIPKEKKEELNILKEKADKAYKLGYNLCSKLSDLDTAKIGLILNYTVFMYEVLKDQKNAFTIANNTYQKTLKCINDDNYDLTLLKDLNKLMGLLKENLSKWAENIEAKNSNIIVKEGDNKVEEILSPAS